MLNSIYIHGNHSQIQYLATTTMGNGLGGIQRCGRIRMGTDCWYWTSSNRSRSMPRVTFLVDLQALLQSSCSTARRSSLYDVRPWTSLESSSVRSVRFYLYLKLRWNWRWWIWCRIWMECMKLWKTDSISIIVKYHAYLRKMTRYNPTRGGKIS